MMARWPVSGTGSTGRLVAVFSHPQTVSEAIGRVLAVTMGPTGSRARWLGGNERGEPIAEDVGAVLVS
jgi:hypothetical protein